MSEQTQRAADWPVGDESLAEVPDAVRGYPVEATPLDEDTSDPDDDLDAESLAAEVDELDEDGPPA